MEISLDCLTLFLKEKKIIYLVILFKFDTFTYSENNNLFMTGAY